MIITIDGPAASGKSTVAREIASKLNVYYLCSGLMFRGLAYVLLNYKNYTLAAISKPDQKDIDCVLNSSLFEYQYVNEKEIIIFNGVNVTSELKKSDIDKAASIISTDFYVRQKLLEYQRALAQTRSIVADGRDTGSVVFPFAEHKFFITATLEERARRWRFDQEKRGILFTDEQARAAIKERDTRDSSRAVDPLIVPEGAIVIDSTDLSKDDVIALILKCVTQKII